MTAKDIIKRLEEERQRIKEEYGYDDNQVNSYLRGYMDRAVAQYNTVRHPATREQICSQQIHCLSCPLSVRITGKDCRTLTQEEINNYTRENNNDC